MSKSQSTLVFILILILLVFVGFLAWQLSAFHTEYDRFVSTKQDDVIASKKLIEDVATMKTKLEAQDAKVASFTEKMTVPENLKAQLSRDFVPQPEYVPVQTLFTVSGFTDAALQVSGDLAAIDAWQLRNKFFLDFVIQESLTLDFDTAKQKFTVTDLIANGLFYQMGLRKGDLIVSLEGKPAASSDDIKAQLMQFSAIKVDVLRDGKKLAIAISYAKPVAEPVAATPAPAEPNTPPH